MPHSDRSSRFYPWLIRVGAALLIVMAFFHGSGLTYVTELVNASDVADFFKRIAPVLFVHPSLHLLELAIFGILILFLPPAAGRKVALILGAAVLIDSILAFYLGAYLPGVLLLVPAVLFGIAGLTGQPGRRIAT